MLKLKRNSRDGMISVIVRDKEFFITRPLAIAFAIAVGIHLALLGLFHVAPFSIVISSHVFPPTNVEAHNPSNESVVAEMNAPALTIRGLPDVPPPIPTIFSQPIFLTVRPVEFAKETHSAEMAFIQIEQDIYQPAFDPLMHLPKEPLNIVVSGILGQYPTLHNGLEGEDSKIPKTDTDRRINYMVMVEGKSGKIFWFELIQPSHDKILDKFAENLLRGMRFDTDPNTLIVSGEIELHFNQGTE